MASLTDQEKKWVEKVAIEDGERGIRNIIHWMMPTTRRCNEFESKYFREEDVGTIYLNARLECWSFLMGKDYLVKDTEEHGLSHAHPTKRRYHKGLPTMKEFQQELLGLGFIELAMKASE